MLAGIVCATIGCAPSGPGAPAPTDVWVADLIEAGSMVGVGTPTNLTRRLDYDNQPAFVPDGTALLYTSRRGAQTDIFRIELESGAAAPVAVTLESEYSATPVPDGDGFSVVRVERDGRQRLWSFPYGGGLPGLLLERPEPVGYHAWVDASTIALYVLGNPATLHLAGLDGSTRLVREGIGRSLQPVPGARALAYVDKPAEGRWWIRRLDLDTGEDEALVATLIGSEDFAWTPEGRLLMAQGAVLFELQPGGESTEWRELADMGPHGAGAITRLAVSPGGDRVAFVAAAR